MGVYFMAKKKFFIDSLLNIVATSIPILILQVITLPIVGSVLGDKQYGLVVTLISLFTLLSLPFGNVLNNLRLLVNKEYKEQEIIGDFNFLLVGNIIISSIAIVFGTIYYQGDFSLINVLLMIVIASLNILREYLLVSFRISLNYKRILTNNLILGFGYLIGTLLFYFTEYWQIIFILGSGSSLFYILNNSKLLTESFKITKLFKKTLYKNFVLFLTSFLKTILSYADKLMLFPLLGPTAVSVYYTATIVGKIILMIITPVNGVVLSYLTQTEKIGLHKFINIMSITGVVGVIGYFITIFVSPPLIYLLYPKWAEESLTLIYVTSANAIIGVMSSVVQPFLLRFNNINWQFFISGTDVIIYIIFAYFFYNLYGLLGFCIGILVANIIRFIITIFIYIFFNKHQTIKKVI
jgi:O-antigen/teichoic acid export membrane protein